jgi:hypothetical protein
VPRKIPIRERSMPLAPPSPLRVVLPRVSARAIEAEEEKASEV